MWHHHHYFYRLGLYRLVGLLALVSLTNACTVPPARVAPAPPNEQRILIPTAEPVSAAQFAAAAAPAVVASAAIEESAAAASASPLTAAQTELLATLPSRGAAPELHNEVWLNTEPLTLADLRGKVVMVEFWTYG